MDATYINILNTKIDHLERQVEYWKEKADAEPDPRDIIADVYLSPKTLKWFIETWNDYPYLKLGNLQIPYTEYFIKVEGRKATPQEDSFFVGEINISRCYDYIPSGYKETYEK